MDWMLTCSCGIYLIVASATCKCIQVEEVLDATVTEKSPIVVFSETNVINSSTSQFSMPVSLIYNWNASSRVYSSGPFMNVTRNLISEGFRSVTTHSPIKFLGKFAHGLHTGLSGISGVLVESLTNSGKQLVVYEDTQFPDFLDQHVRAMMDRGTVGDFHRRLCFIVICHVDCVETVLDKAMELDLSIGQGALLRHFSTWLVVSDDVPSLNHTLFDNVALLNSGSQLNIDDYNLSTLLWTPEGREWSTVRPPPTGVQKVYSSIFPNTQTGLNGRELIISTLPWAPFALRRYVDGRVVYEGSSIDVMDLLQNHFNFSYRVMEPSDGEWGQEIHNGTWSGVIGNIQKQEAHLCPTPWAISESRLRLMDFSTPVTASIFSALYRSPETTGGENDLFYLLQVFDWRVYLAATGGFFWITLLLICSVVGKWRGNKVKQTIYLLTTTVQITWRQGLHEEHRHNSTKLSVATWSLFCLILGSVYIGNLVAFTAVDKTSPPFSTMEELANQEEYGVGAADGTYAVNVMRHSEIPMFKALFEKIQRTSKNGVLSNNKELTEKMLSERFVMIASHEVVSQVLAQSCDVVTMKEKIFPVHSAFIYPRQSPLQKLFDKQLGIVRDRRIFEKANELWSPKQNQCIVHSSSPILKFRNIMSFVIAIAACVVASCLILLWEMFFNKFSLSFESGKTPGM